MKHFITLLILLTILSFGQVMKTEFHLFVNIALIVLIFLTTFSWEHSVLNTNYDADFKMRSQKKTISLFDIGNALFWTAFLFLMFDTIESAIFIAFFFWSIPIAEFVMWFIYKKKKPFTLFIKDNELILNKRWTQKRNLTELTQIRFDRFSKNLKLDFKSKSEISIKTTEYKTDKIKTLLGILIEKSENEVFIPNNYEPKIKNSC